MFCKNCGNNVNEGSKFCRECGTEIISEPKIPKNNTCPKCGNWLNEGAMFCNNCGYQTGGFQEKTVNEICPYCNNPIKLGAIFCGKCGKSLKDDATEIKTSKPKKDKGLIFLIVLLVIVLLASACIIGITYLKSNSINIEIPKIENAEKNKNIDTDKNKISLKEDSENTEISTNEEDAENTEIAESEKQTQKSEIAELPDDFDIESEVSLIKSQYYYTQENLSSFEKKIFSSGMTAYFDENTSLSKIDIPANSADTYTKYYYFNENGLYFVFAFDGKKENRLYFKNNELFRWIDEFGKTHDNEFENSSFVDWQTSVVTDFENSLEEIINLGV